MNHPEEFLVPMTLFVALAIVFWKYFESRHRENMAMIEKGTYVTPQKKPVSSNAPRFLMWGLLTVFVATALLLGLILHYEFNVVEEVTPALMLLFAGIALLANYGISHHYEITKEFEDEVVKNALSKELKKITREQSSQP